MKKVHGRSAIAVMHYCMIEAIDNERITVTIGRDAGFHNETFLTTKLDGEVHVSGKVLVPFKRIEIMIRRLNSFGGSVVVSAPVGEPTNVNFKHPVMEAEVSGMYPQDYPVLPPEPKEFQALSASVFDELRKAYPYASDDDCRANLTGVNFSTHENKLELVASDGHRAIRLATGLEVKLERLTKGDPERAPIVPRHFCQVACYLNKKKRPEVESVNIGFAKGPDRPDETNEEWVWFKFGRHTLRSRLVTGSFPDVTRVIPDESSSDFRFLMGSRQFLRSLHLVSAFAPRTNCVKVEVTGGEFLLECRHPDYGAIETKVVGLTPALTESPEGPCKMGFNWKYLKQVAKDLGVKTLHLRLIDGLTPAVFADAESDDDRSFAVVMPMRM